MNTIEIEARRGLEPGTFDTFFRGSRLCTSTTPFRDSATLLLAADMPPDSILVMSQPGMLTCLLAPLNYIDARMTPKVRDVEADQCVSIWPLRLRCIRHASLAADTNDTSISASTASIRMMMGHDGT